MTAHEKLLTEQVEMLVRECNQHRDTIQQLTQLASEARVECNQWRAKYERLVSNELNYQRNAA